jgi:hypothetical protein
MENLLYFVAKQYPALYKVDMNTRNIWRLRPDGTWQKGSNIGMRSIHIWNEPNNKYVYRVSTDEARLWMIK